VTDRAVTAPLRTSAMTARRLALAASLTLVFSACSGDADASPGTTVAAEAPATSTTDAVAPPEATAPTTEPAPDTSPPTLPTEPTITAPPTTAPPAPPDEDQVKQDVIDSATASWVAFNELLLDPNADEPWTEIALTRTGDALDRAIEVAMKLRLEGRKSVTNVDLPATIRPDPNSVLVDPVAGTAQVEYCRLGSNVAVEIGGNEDGTDRIIDDSISSYLERDQFVLRDGAWLKSGGQTVQKFEGATTCLG